MTSNEETRTVTIDSKVSNGGNSHFLGSNLYMDAAAFGWALEYKGFGFWISNGTQYIGIDADDNLVLKNEPTEWIIVTAEGVKAQRLEEMAAATAENGVDATWLLQNPNFNRNDQRVSAWTVSEDCTNKNLNGGNNVNNCAESYHSTFTISQLVEGAPAGVYTLTAQGFYREDGDSTAAPVFFANGVTAEVPGKTGAENSMSAASESFANGLYTIEPITFVVGEDSTLTVGVQSTSTSQWVIWDNFRLTYFGPEVVAETVTFDFADPNFRDSIGTAMTDTKGYIYNETFTAEGATLQITSGSAPSRIYVDNNRGQNLVTYKEYATLTFRAPEGKAITKIEFTAAGNSNINNFTASSGTIEGMVWTGNADGVRFTQGGTSYLANAIVSMVDKTNETAALAPIEYVECANIAAFNALEPGTYAKITLTDVEVTGISADGYSTVFVQDATGGCWVQYTSLNARMREKTKGNGFVYGVKRLTSGNSQLKEAEDTPKSEITGGTIDEYTMIEGTIAEVNVPENLNRVVKSKGAAFEATSATAGKLTQDENTINVNNGTETANQQLHKIDTWAKGDKMENVTIVAILVATSATAQQLLPISMVEEQIVGIAEIDAANSDMKIYNLQGVRVANPQKGVFIHNGKKVVIK
jgi:hypothetical protein